MASACGDDDSGSRETGELGGLCYPNGTCNVTLFCSSGVCVSGDGGVGRDGMIVLIDGPTTNCADDSQLEPNDTTAQAFITPVDNLSSANFAGLAICPAGDTDVYSVSLSSQKDLTATILYESPSVAVTVSILNAGGATLVNGAATGVARQVRASGVNFPAGTYYVQVSSGAGGTNNYSLQLAAN